MAAPLILIVDDEPFNVDFLEQELDELGYQTQAASNGQAALDQVKAAPPDLILLDIMMPILDGFAVLGRLKADPATRDIPVIIISAMTDMASIVKGVKLGAEDYLPKPFESVLLEARIATGLDKKRRRDQELEYLRQVEQLTVAAHSIENNVYQPATIASVATRQDALGNLARVFQRMAETVHLREQRIKQQLAQLQLDIEERQKALSETASVYIPMDRRQALAHNETLPDRAMGAALFADLSGFTALTEALAQELGFKRGAEEITFRLNRIYGALIDEVHRYHGSVIAFSGDAITCWFNETADPSQPAALSNSAFNLYDSSLRAVACALAMQTAIHQFASANAASLAVKVAVAAGPVRRLLVGNSDLLQMEVIAGRTLDDLAAAEHLAGRGEVVVQGQIVAELRDLLIVSEWRAGNQFAIVTGLTRGVAASPWPTLSPDAIPDSKAQPWLLPAVFEKVTAGKSDYLSELRPAAALFLNFGGIDYDGDDEAGQRLGLFIEWVEQIADRYEGSLLQVTVGDKGSYLYIAFGAPVAHNDDAVRAVSAALEFRSPPAYLSFVSGLQIGISYGQMRAGAYGSPAQRTYGAIGDKTNLAARLMQAAEGSILCDEATFQAAHEHFDFEALRPIAVKGKLQPIAIYRPLRQRTTTSAASLVGRAAERALLIDRLSPADQLTLKVASVIGRLFAADLLTAIFPNDNDRANLAEHLQTLADLDLLVQHTAAEAPQLYSFKDPLTHETAYNLMLFAQRRQLHRAIAEWHERTYQAELASYYPMLAHHWRQADDVAKAIYYLEKAGQQAQHNGEFEQAREFFNELLTLDGREA